MMRWWWFGPAVERAELDRELVAMAQAGIGGVEVAFVYPLETATTTFGSPALLADLRWTAERAQALGLRFDVTLGSGWSYGGPHIGPDLAARGLRWDRRELGAGAALVDVAAGWPGDELVAAYLAPGSAQEPARDVEPLTTVPTSSGWHVEIPDGGAPRHVLLAWSRLTGQQVKRAAAGAEGPVLDHYSEAATLAHLRAVADPILDAVPAELLGSVFCDSLEVYGADWTPDLPAAFEERRGYPLLPQLPQLLDGGDTTHRFRADYHRTLVELYEDRFVAVVQRWAQRRGVPFRLQGYGCPPATLSSFRHADAVEGEGWGWTELTPTRWASSAAHHYGRDVVSAEAWTWVHSPSFRATPLDLLAEAHEHLLNGVTLLVGHGWPYSPSEAPGLGWFFYAAGCLDDRNPWWPAMPELTAYLARLGRLLQQGERVSDVAVYVPTTDVLAGMGTALGGSLDTWREAARRIGSDTLGAIRRTGLDYDLFDDDVVTLVRPTPPAVVLVPGGATLPEQTRDWLTTAVRAGSTVLAIGGPIDVDGARVVAAATLASTLRSAVDRPIVEESTEVGIVHRRVGDHSVLFLANTAPVPQRVTPAGSASWQRWDPRTGAAAPHPGGTLELAPYEATVLVADGVGVTDAEPIPATTEAIPLPRWQVEYADGGAEEVTLPHRWEDDPARAGYSGAATYRTGVELPAGAGTVLDLGPAVPEADRSASVERGIVGPSFHAAVRGPVGEVAVVRVNGVACGALWSPPYRLDVGHAVRPGTNDLEITVHNTAANRLAVDTEVDALVRRTEERYGRRFAMQELDRAADGLASGLLAVPRLLVSRR